MTKLIPHNKFSTIEFENFESKQLFLENIENLLSAIEIQLTRSSSPIEKEYLLDCIEHTSTLLHYGFSSSNVQTKLIQIQRITFERYKQKKAIVLRQEIEAIASTQMKGDENPNDIDFCIFCDDLLLKSLEQISRCFSLITSEQHEVDSKKNVAISPDQEETSQRNLVTLPYKGL